MAMIGGSVTVADDASASGTGLAKALYDARAAKIVADSNWSHYAHVAQVQVLRAVADQANADGPAIVDYLHANAKAHVTTESLGKTPNPNNADTAIVAPASPVDIPIT